jgi:hypothetical protein
MTIRRTIALAALLICAGAAQAQTQGQTQDRPPAPAVDPKACAPGERMGPGERTPNPPATTGESLSDKLARTDGVICPPSTGADIRLPTPEGGRTPVIPPPGSPGGDQGVQPK